LVEVAAFPKKLRIEVCRRFVEFTVDFAPFSAYVKDELQEPSLC
jgi:hypothetical protein